MSDLELTGITKSFGKTSVLHGVDLSLQGGEFLTLLGPSGCGKSTLLNIIAGLETPSAGRVQLAGATLSAPADKLHLPPERRNIGMVFQSYALWPHMTVLDNVTTPLRLRGQGRAKARRAALDMLDRLELAETSERHPFEISGGQQQRVALARALVGRPDLLLLDEPLSNLDARLRDRAQSWLRALQRDLGVTTVLVTHDQTEALAISDRVAVMREGRILQIAEPLDLYHRPANAFVADFVGAANVITGRVEQRLRAELLVSLADGLSLRVAADIPSSMETVCLTIRPEDIRITRPSGAFDNQMEIVDRRFIGSGYFYGLTKDDVTLRAFVNERFDVGPVAVSIASGRAHIVSTADRSVQ